MIIPEAATAAIAGAIVTILPLDRTRLRGSQMLLKLINQTTLKLINQTTVYTEVSWSA